MIAFLRGIRVLHFPTIKVTRVRIRLLLFLLVFIVVSGMPPVHAALGIAPRCLPPASLQGKTADAKLPVAELSRELPSYDPEDRDYLIRTIAFELGQVARDSRSAHLLSAR